MRKLLVLIVLAAVIGVVAGRTCVDSLERAQHAAAARMAQAGAQ